MARTKKCALCGNSPSEDLEHYVDCRTPGCAMNSTAIRPQPIHLWNRLNRAIRAGRKPRGGKVLARGWVGEEDLGGSDLLYVCRQKTLPCRQKPCIDCRRVEVREVPSKKGGGA